MSLEYWNIIFSTDAHYLSQSHGLVISALNTNPYTENSIALDRPVQISNEIQNWKTPLIVAAKAKVNSYENPKTTAMTGREELQAR